MEFRDTRLATSLGRDEQYEQLGLRSQAFDLNTKVYITLPGGKREAFQFAPHGDVINQVTRVESMKYYVPVFKSLNGSTSSLQVKLRSSDAIPTAGQRTVLLSKGSDEKFRQGSNLFNLADPLFGLEYVLTTKEGTAYIIDPGTGRLTEVRDSNGNRIIYSDDAITSSTGQKVMFERDGQGRIVAVKDPMQEYIRYEYDGQGDLISVSDRQKNITRMVYDTSYDDPKYAGTDDPGREKRSHFLREIIDPLGRVGARTEYDETGRLKQIVDVNGKAVDLGYDLTNDRQVVKDQLGNEMVYVYDDRGNVLTEIDAAGKITQRQYDATNNVLSETIISDRSGVAGFINPAL